MKIIILSILLIGCNSQKNIIDDINELERSTSSQINGTYFSKVDKNIENEIRNNIKKIPNNPKIRLEILNKILSKGRLSIPYLIEHVHDKTIVRDVNNHANWSPRSNSGLDTFNTLGDFCYDTILWIIGINYDKGKLGYLYENKLLSEWYENHKNHSLEEMRSSLRAK